MGVPSLFRWLTKKYPKITVSATEEQNIVINGISIPVDATKPNPNGFEVDNLYLDMNGIIHPCTHPEDKPPPESEEEAMVEIFAYIDRIMDIVRPRKLVYMAIDGVAPRAKMNQQRSRRFRASREASLISHPDDDGEQGDSSKWKFDSNCITPGTPFMSRLAECLKFYIADRLSRRAGWANVKVILSDASVPGEGEHKIIDFIRRQRLGARYDPNTRHVLYGLDADLIMLALATHEPHFKILREDIFSKEKGKHQCRLCGGTGHYADECTGKLPQEKKEPKKIPFVFLNISVLREYLEVEMRVPGARFPFNLERSIDDWVFLCFFVGNDFLPHMPSLEIREGAIDRLITIYKAMLPQVGGYLTDSGSVNLAGVQTIMLELGRQEDEIFRKRKEDEMRREESMNRKYSSQQQEYSEVSVTVKDDKQTIESSSRAMSTVNSVQRDNISFARSIRAELAAKTTSTPTADTVLTKRKIEETVEVESESTAKELDESVDVDEEGDEEEESKEEKQVEDPVKLWEPGYKERYYQSKFAAEMGDKDFKKKLIASYVQGLCWVLKYYYQGCQSWRWFYPYNYSPFASDFNISDFEKQVSSEFELGSPFKPFEQLMAVFPASSKQHIPECFWSLMTHESSPIIEFYPESFVIDLNGKKHEWQGVALLPFVDEQRLLNEMQKYYSRLNQEEKKRNSFGADLLFVGKMHALYDMFMDMYGDNSAKGIVPINALGGSLTGFVAIDNDGTVPGSPVKSPVKRLDNLQSNSSIKVQFFNPTLPKGCRFIAKLLEGARLPARALDRDAIYWFQNGGRNTKRFSQQNQFGGRRY